MTGLCRKPGALGLLLLFLMAQTSCLIWHSGPRSGLIASLFYKKTPATKSFSEQADQRVAKMIRPVKLGVSVEGRPIKGYCFGKGEDKKTVVLLGGLRGNAPGGEVLLESLVQALSANPTLVGAWQVLIVPACNPDGLERETLTNANDVDLNLNFPHEKQAAPPLEEASGFEPETAALLKIFALHPPDLALSIRSDGGCIDCRGEGAFERAQALSEACQMPMKALAVQSGSLEAYLGEVLGIPCITMVLDYFHKRRIMAPSEKELLTAALLTIFQDPVAAEQGNDK